MSLSLSVTRRKLELDTRDHVTGWYAKHYAESLMSMLVIPKAINTDVDAIVT